MFELKEVTWKEFIESSKPTEYQNPYKGYTHYIPLFLLPLWKQLFCKRGWHIWDEIYTTNYEHYLFCDACEKEVHINDNPPKI